MFSLSASITINKMKLEMAPPIWDQLNCNSFKLNHISSILESYFFISRIIFLQFRSKNGRKFWTENRPCSKSGKVSRPTLNISMKFKCLKRKSQSTINTHLTCWKAWCILDSCHWQCLCKILSLLKKKNNQNCKFWAWLGDVWNAVNSEKKKLCSSVASFCRTWGRGS